MIYNTNSLESEVPLVWPLRRENNADICFSLNTAVIDPQSCTVRYVERAQQYREEIGTGKRERFIIVTDDLNAARKTSYLFAGDVKNDYVDPDSSEVGDEEVSADDYDENEDDDDILYFNKSEVEGVYMAEIDLHTFPKDIGPNPGFTMELDGAFFYGAESEQDIADNLNTILTCDLPYAAVVVGEEMLKTDAVRNLLFDYWFSMYDCRGAGLDRADLIKLITCFVEENDNIVAFHDFSSEKIADMILGLRGRSVREEDILRIADMAQFHSVQEEYGLYDSETVMETLMKG